MFDRNQTGTIDIYEFGDLFNYINQWKALFESIDNDRSGSIEYPELSRGEFLLFMQTSLTPGCFDFNYRPI
jgi:Ca2+-binding EF-hand superfamily protein